MRLIKAKSLYFNPYILLYTLLTWLTIQFMSTEARKEICTAVAWTQYKKSFGKFYANKSEDALRRQIFCANLQHINQHNAESKDSGFELGLNHMSDWNDNEIGVMLGYDQRFEPEEMMGGRPDDVQQSGLKSLKSISTLDKLKHRADNIPKQLDWRDFRNRVGPVQNQGDCGACWAFVTTGLIEGQQMRSNKNGTLTLLSAQNLLDCDTSSGGCVGGTSYRALYYIGSSGGLETERDYPFVSDKTGSTNKCDFDPALAHESTTSIKGPVFLKADDEEYLQGIVASYGPVAVSMEATWSFYHYRSGIFFETQPRIGRLNHEVLIIGYGTSDSGEDYWIVKNSWGTEWGEEGFGRIARNRGNHCGIAERPVIYKV